MTRPRHLEAEPGDLVIYFGSEWTVHTVEDHTALLRKHDDPDATGTTVRVGRYGIRPLVKAADR